MNLEKEYTLKNIKEYLKKIAKYIRIKKQLRKTVYRDLSRFDEKDINYVKNNRLYLSYLKYDFRMFHIAYCLFRGKTMQQIENKNEYDDPNHIPQRAKVILEDIKLAMEELKNEETLYASS